MLSSILGMEELTVEDIMTPHAEIIGIDITQNIEVAQKIIGSSNTVDCRFLKNPLIT